MKLFFEIQKKIVIVKLEDNQLFLASQITQYGFKPLSLLYNTWDEQQKEDYEGLMKRLPSIGQKEQKEYVVEEMKKLGLKLVKEDDD